MRALPPDRPAPGVRVGPVLVFLAVLSLVVGSAPDALMGAVPRATGVRGGGEQGPPGQVAAGRGAAGQASATSGEEHAAGQEAAAGEQHAADAEHAGEEAHEEAPWWEFPARLVNFALLLALLWWALVETPPFIGNIFSFPGLRALLANRAARIQEEKALAEERSEEAAEIRTASAARLDRIEQEVESLVRDAREDAEREKRRAEEEGRERAEKIRETASRELRAEALAAQREVRSFVAELAVGMAETTLRKQLTPADQDRLMNDYLARIGARIE